MNQIAEHHRPNVEVTITAELRALLAARNTLPADVDAIAQTAEAVVQTEKPVGKPAWVSLCLRRDGGRPRRFIGMKVHEALAEAKVGEEVIHHGLTLYHEKDGGLICALHAEPGDPLAGRPAFWCEPVSDPSQFQRLSERWKRDVLAGFQTVDEHITGPSADPEHLSMQFNAFTAQCLRNAQTH